jgi:hypothetical protein
MQFRGALNQLSTRSLPHRSPSSGPRGRVSSASGQAMRRGQERRSFGRHQFEKKDKSTNPRMCCFSKSLGLLCVFALDVGLRWQFLLFVQINEKVLLRIIRASPPTGSGRALRQAQGDPFDRLRGTKILPTPAIWDRRYRRLCPRLSMKQL